MAEMGPTEHEEPTEETVEVFAHETHEMTRKAE